MRLAKLTSKSDANGQAHAGKGASCVGKRRLVRPAERSVEEGEEIGAFGCECRWPVEVPTAAVAACPARGFSRISSGAKKTRSLKAKYQDEARFAGSSPTAHFTYGRGEITSLELLHPPNGSQ